jgi:hypothetical protein
MQALFTVDEPANWVGLHTILMLSYPIIGNISSKIFIPCYDESIDFIFMTLAYNVFCMATS